MLADQALYGPSTQFLNSGWTGRVKTRRALAHTRWARSVTETLRIAKNVAIPVRWAHHGQITAPPLIRNMPADLRLCSQKLPNRVHGGA